MEKETEYSSKIEHLFEVVKIDGDVESFFESIKNVQSPLLRLFAAHFCLSEVHNGGFLQLFWNSTGVLFPEAVDGYEALGLPKLAGVFNAAGSYLGSSYPRDREDRWDALHQASGRSEEELAAIFRRANDFYLAYQEATATLPLDDLDQLAWNLAKTENGGFQERAVAYAVSLNAPPV